MQYSFDFAGNVLAPAEVALNRRSGVTAENKHLWEWPPELDEEDERILDAVWDRIGREEGKRRDRSRG